MKLGQNEAVVDGDDMEEHKTQVNNTTNHRPHLFVISTSHCPNIVFYSHINTHLESFFFPQHNNYQSLNAKMIFDMMFTFHRIDEMSLLKLAKKNSRRKLHKINYVNLGFTDTCALACK